MPQVAYYRRTILTRTEGIALIDKQIKDANMITKHLSGNDLAIATRTKEILIARLQESKRSVLINGTYEVIDRIKVEVPTEDAALNVEMLPGFVSYAIGGHKSIRELIARRKKEGRADWYC